MKVDSLEALYKCYMNDIYQYLLRLSGHPQTAEDLLHDTFVRAYECLESYQGESVRPWLFTVAHNIYIDWYRREKRQIQTDPIILNELNPAVDPGPERVVLLKEEFDTWIELSRLLPEKSRQILLLRDYYEFSYQEIADILNITVSNVKITLYRARQKIREVISDEL
ncbi:MAG: sigma-70 family RNA polymerase sigma factor [Syntrophomonadaceae bacterium]|jgi:RNA polymerase sigma-70 factor (ECF subfamily)